MWAITLTFLVVYLRGIGVTLEQAGIVASLSLISAIVSAFLVGRIYDHRIQDARKILLACAGGMISGMASMVSTSLITITAAQQQSAFPQEAHSPWHMPGPTRCQSSTGRAQPTCTMKGRSMSHG